jgi:aryl-alcohol dehydrogenase-like predicted oxidoreductase
LALYVTFMTKECLPDALHMGAERSILAHIVEYVTLGRIGLQTSVVGLGSGGHSQLGQRTGASAAHSMAVVRRALELGITFVDTAEAYGTEAIVGAALRSSERTAIALSTKKSLTEQERLITAAEFMRGLEASLSRLRTDYIDVYHLHAVRADQYDYVVAELLPAMQKLRDQGKIRFCRAEPGIHVVLSGTGNLQHLEQNVTSILRPPLPTSIRQRLVTIFAQVDTISGD